MLSDYNTWVETPAGFGVFNGRTGNLVKLSAHRKVALEQFLAGETSFDEDMAPLVAELIKAGIVVPGDLDELVMLERLYEGRRHGDAIQLTVVTSLGCNFDCPYCFEDKRPSKLRPEVGALILDYVRDRLPASKVHITWFGGEPLQAADELIELSTALQRLCAEYDVPYSSNIITNGWYLDAAMAIRLRAAGVSMAQVTIDGPREINDRYRPHLNANVSTYDRIVKSLDDAADHISILVRVNIDRSNVTELDRLFEDLERLELTGRVRLAVAQITGGGRDDQGLPRFTRKEFADVQVSATHLAQLRGFDAGGPPLPVKGTPCTAVNANDLVVGPEGELWKCWDDVGHDRLIRGNLVELASQPIDVDDWLDESPFRDDQCRSCIALPGCMGGCPARRRAETRSEQCGTFRHNHHQRIEHYLTRQLQADDCASAEAASARAAAFETIQSVVADTTDHPYANPAPASVAVTIGRSPSATQRQLTTA